MINFFINLQFAILFFTSLQIHSQNQKNLRGFSLGESIESVSKKGYTQIGYEEVDNTKLYRFNLKDKNAISVTLDNNKVVYIELDNMDRASKTTGFLDFKFSDTKLIDITERFDSKGFIYENRNAGKMNDKFYTITCYKIKNTDAILALFCVTNLDNLKNIEDQNELQTKLELFAVILAKEEYLDSIWGEKKNYPKDANHLIEI
jgi:hypothetical protein